MTKNNRLYIGDAPVHWKDVVQVSRHQSELALSQTAWDRIRNARAIVDHIVTRNEKAYGITTGLGALCDQVLSGEQLNRLSVNTLRSHACGIGSPLTTEQTRAIICAAVINFSHGKSGVHPDIVQALIDLLNKGVTPYVPARGSVGYLTHMAHIGLCLIGEGKATFEGALVPADKALEQAGISMITPGAKDGLCLVSSVPCMTGLACIALDESKRLFKWADTIAAMSFEAHKGQIDAFDRDALNLKKNPNTSVVGNNLRLLLQDSTVLARHKGLRTQDALSMRSIPQVHGACRDQFDHTATLVQHELNSVSDNPVLIGTAEDYRIVSNANPHGESVALALDGLKIAISELGGISERRLDRLLNPLVSGLPAFLVREPGVNSGLMITQYTAASLASENKQLSQPSVVDNFVTSALQEDHLSFGTPAALQLLHILDNSRHILAIEYLCAAQALSFYGEDELASGTREAMTELRCIVPVLEEDRFLAPDIEQACALIKAGKSIHDRENSIAGKIR